MPKTMVAALVTTIEPRTSQQRPPLGEPSRARPARPVRLGGSAAPASASGAAPAIAGARRGAGRIQIAAMTRR